jgi:hypothetical protein
LSASSFSGMLDACDETNAFNGFLAAGFIDACAGYPPINSAA